MAAHQETSVRGGLPNVMQKTMSVLVRLVSVGLQLVYVKSYMHYLTVAELGYAFYLNTLSYAINALLLVPADLYQQACLASSYTGVFPLRAVLSLNKRILLLAALLAAVLGTPVCLAGKISPLDFLLIFGLSISLYVSTSTRNYLNNRGHGLFTGWMLLLEAGLKVLSFLLFLYYGMSHISAFVLSTVTAFVLEFIGLGAFFRRYVPYSLAKTTTSELRTMFATSGVITFSAVCNWLQLQGYRIVYVWAGLPEVAGLYASVSNVGLMGMNALSTVFSQILLPKVYSSRGQYIVRYTRYALVLCLIVLIGYVALGKVLLAVLTKREFKSYAGLMLFGILVEAGNLLIGATSTYFTLRGTSFNLLTANIAGICVVGCGIAMCMAWRPHNAYCLGAVLVVSQSVVCANLYMKARRDLTRDGTYV